MAREDTGASESPPAERAVLQTMSRLIIGCVMGLLVGDPQTDSKVQLCQLIMVHN